MQCHRPASILRCKQLLPRQHQHHCAVPPAPLLPPSPVLPPSRPSAPTTRHRAATSAAPSKRRLGSARSSGWRMATTARVSSAPVALVRSLLHSMVHVCNRPRPTKPNQHPPTNSATCGRWPCVTASAPPPGADGVPPGCRDVPSPGSNYSCSQQVVRACFSCAVCCFFIHQLLP